MWYAFYNALKTIVIAEPEGEASNLDTSLTVHLSVCINI